MTTHRRADAARRAAAGVGCAITPTSGVSTPASTVRRAPVRNWAACCALFANVSACTLLGDEFEPLLLPAADAGAFTRANVVTAEPAEDAAPLGCAADAVDGTPVNGEDSSCATAIGLLDPGARVGAEAEPDAGASPEVSLSLPPCEGDFGPFGTPERLTGLPFNGDIFGPSLSADGRTLYFSAYVAGEQQIYSAVRNARGRAFSDVTPLAAVNSTGREGTPFISANAERFYFFSERDGGLGNRDIWVSQRESEGLGQPELVRGINSRESDLLPWLSGDELTVLFVSGRPGGRGSADLWRATRAGVDQAFDAPVNLFELSSAQNEGRVVLSSDGLTAYFSSDREGGRGSPDLWTASRQSIEQPFSALVDMWPLNTNSNEQDVTLSSDETELFFASNRRGATSELWRAARTCS
jgi:hypothetical protein